MTPSRPPVRPGALPPDGERSWRVRLDDPDEPLFTVAIAADLLGVDAQYLRRLADTLDPNPSRPSGNQRRYSRHEVERLGRAHDLVGEGHNATSATRILDLEDRLAAAGHPDAAARRPGPTA